MNNHFQRLASGYVDAVASGAGCRPNRRACSFVCPCVGQTNRSASTQLPNDRERHPADAQRFFCNCSSFLGEVEIPTRDAGLAMRETFRNALFSGSMRAEDQRARRPGKRLAAGRQESLASSRSLQESRTLALCAAHNTAS